MSDRLYCVYIMTNIRHSVLYTGVTSDLQRRVWQHVGKFVDSFTSRYAVDQLVYYETCEAIVAAITREKQIKAGSRAKKVALITDMNPEWRNLAEEL
jgi:putative endonuclease